jgi:hypothetical protein
LTVPKNPGVPSCPLGILPTDSNCIYWRLSSAERRSIHFHTKREPDRIEASVPSPTLLRSGTPPHPTQLYQSTAVLSTEVTSVIRATCVGPTHRGRYDRGVSARKQPGWRMDRQDELRHRLVPGRAAAAGGIVLVHDWHLGGRRLGLPGGSLCDAAAEALPAGCHFGLPSPRSSACHQLLG